MEQEEFEKELALLRDMKRRADLLKEAAREMKERRATMQELDDDTMKRLREKLKGE